MKLGMFRAFKSFKKCRDFSNVGTGGFHHDVIFGEEDIFRLSIGQFMSFYKKKERKLAHCLELRIVGS
ncbi:MAG: hypothetical protein ACI4CY_02230, partial [Candidatus Gastranaerophilaceae bacterium]